MASTKESQDVDFDNETVNQETKGLAKLAESVASILGPIGVSIGPSVSERPTEGKRGEKAQEGEQESSSGFGGMDLGPIGMTVGENTRTRIVPETAGQATQERDPRELAPGAGELSTEAWQQTHEADGKVDLWLEDNFNQASRAGWGERENYQWSGTEAEESDAPVHNVTVKGLNGEVYHIQSPEDRYILFEAEEQGMDLPQACRMGCCTQCTVKVTSGTLHQPQGLGISAGLKEKGYGLLCVGYALSDLEVELQDPDEAYDIQFGGAFDQLATDKDGNAIERDDFALELADMDE